MRYESSPKVESTPKVDIKLLQLNKTPYPVNRHAILTHFGI